MIATSLEILKIADRLGTFPNPWTTCPGVFWAFPNAFTGFPFCWRGSGNSGRGCGYMLLLKSETPWFGAGEVLKV